MTKKSDDIAELNPESLMSVDPAYWALTSKIRLQSGPFSFAGHEYQVEPLRSRARRRCTMKATQLGFTEVEVLRVLHGLIFGRYPRGVLYMFPTADDVQEFSKSRFATLIQANRETIGRFVKSGGKGTDTANLKKVCDAFLYLRGARLTQSVGGDASQKESAKLRSIPADELVFDEVDLMDSDVIEKAKGRLGASTIKGESYVSNPTLPDTGIDAIWQKSDQRQWFRTCAACGTKTCAELSFPECVKLRQDGTGYIGCDKCGREVGISPGEWVPAVRANTDDMMGYQLGQLSSSFNDPAEILADFRDPPNGNLGDVIRLRLGFPYVAAEDRLSASTIRECCGPDLMPESHSGPCAMGVDVGKIKHVVIGTRTGADQYEIVKAVALSRWEDIHDLARKYNVKSAVIDARPYEDEARRFQKAERYRIYLCEYAENTALGTQYNDVTGLVRVNRTEIFDATHRLFADKRVKLPRPSKALDEFITQCCNVAKVLETNKRSGTSIYRYRKVGSGGDHYRNAMNYFLLAAPRVGITSVFGRYGKRKPRTEYAII